MPSYTLQLEYSYSLWYVSLRQDLEHHLAGFLAKKWGGLSQNAQNIDLQALI